MQANLIWCFAVVVSVVSVRSGSVDAQMRERYPNLMAESTLAAISGPITSNTLPPLTVNHACFDSGQMGSPRYAANSKSFEKQLQPISTCTFYSRYQQCTHCPDPDAACRSLRIAGFKGQPYCPRNIGGCQCGSPCCKYHISFNSYWPYPLKPRLDQYRTPLWVAPKHFDYWDLFNKLGDLKMLPYQRKDNGYSGRNADPYGCLGASYYR